MYRYTHLWPRPRPRPRAPRHLPSTTMYRHIVLVLRVVNAVCVVRVLVGLYERATRRSASGNRSIDRCRCRSIGVRAPSAHPWHGFVVIIGIGIGARSRHADTRQSCTHTHTRRTYTYILLNPPKCSLLPPNTPHCAPPRYAESTRSARTARMMKDMLRDTAQSNGDAIESLFLLIRASARNEG